MWIVGRDAKRAVVACQASHAAASSVWLVGGGWCRLFLVDIDVRVCSSDLHPLPFSRLRAAGTAVRVPFPVVPALQLPVWPAAEEAGGRRRGGQEAAVSQEPTAALSLDGGCGAVCLGGASVESAPFAGQQVDKHE